MQIPIEQFEFVAARIKEKYDRGGGLQQEGQRKVFFTCKAALIKDDATLVEVHDLKGQWLGSSLMIGENVIALRAAAEPDCAGIYVESDNPSEELHKLIVFTGMYEMLAMEDY